jgi:xylulokinase
MPIVLGLDSSTQSVSAVVLDTAAGTIIHEASVSFGEDLPDYGQPSGFMPNGEDGEVHSDPLMWLDGLELLFTRLAESDLDLSQIKAIAGSGQQHGSVYLDHGFADTVQNLDPSKTLKSQVLSHLTRQSAPIWMDTSTSNECAEIAKAMGGDAEVCRRSGSIAIERFTGPQIRRFAKMSYDSWELTGVIHLVSSFMASILAGQSVAIDHGDGAGMNLLNLAAGDWDHDLLDATAPGLREKLPPVQPSGTVAGKISNYFVERFGLSPDCEVVLFSGDNPCSLVGMGASRPGKVVISLGTSDTLFAAMPEARTDPRGYGHAFGNPMGGFMSLICFLNGSLARERVKDELGLDWSDFEKEALAATSAGNEGRLMLPFFGPEITPRVESRDAVYLGWPEGERDPASVVRAVLEGQFLNMKVHSRWLGVDPETIYLTGGASQNDGIAQTVANVFGVPVSRLTVAGSAALGAAMRAAHAACGVALAELENAYCQPEAGSTVTPEGGVREIFDDLEQKWVSALHDSFSETNH